MREISGRMQRKEAWSKANRLAENGNMNRSNGPRAGKIPTGQESSSDAHTALSSSVSQSCCILYAKTPTSAINSFLRLAASEASRPQQSSGQKAFK